MLVISPINEEDGVVSPIVIGFCIFSTLGRVHTWPRLLNQAEGFRYTCRIGAITMKYVPAAGPLWRPRCPRKRSASISDQCHVRWH